MRRLLGLLLPLALATSACGDDDASRAGTTTTTAAEDARDPADEGGDVPTDPAPTTATTGTTVVTDAPAGEGPGGAGEDEGLGDALLVADLTPGAEVPGPGADGAAGRFEAELVDGVLCMDMEVRDLGGEVVGAHVHQGDAETAGPVVVDLGTPTSQDAGSASWEDGCTEVADDVIEGIAAAPEQHYVDVHTPTSPDGAVRGQLTVASVFDRSLD